METEIRNRRLELEEIDRKIVELLHQRADKALALGKLKSHGGKPVFSPANEEKVHEEIILPSKGHFPKPAMRKIFVEIISACRSIQGDPRICVFSEKDGWMHRHAQGVFGSSASLVLTEEMETFLRRLMDGETAMGIIPFLSTLPGFDRLIEHFVQNRLFVVAESDDLRNGNSVRCLTIAPRPNVDFQGNLKGSLVVTFPEKVGALYDFLSLFKARNLNLFGIGLLHFPEKPWNELFFLDFEIPKKQNALDGLLMEMQKKCLFYRFLGFYPSKSPEKKSA